MVTRYWIMRDHKLEGPYSLEELKQLPDFTATTLICREGEDIWKPATEALKIRTEPVRWAPKVNLPAARVPRRPPEIRIPPPSLSPAPLPTLGGVSDISILTSSPSVPTCETSKPVAAIDIVAPVSDIKPEWREEFKPFSSSMACSGPSQRVWILFMCLSFVNSFYWGTSTVSRGGGIELTLPLPAEYLSPLPPAVRHRTKAALLSVSTPTVTVHSPKVKKVSSLRKTPRSRRSSRNR